MTKVENVELLLSLAMIKTISDDIKRDAEEGRATSVVWAESLEKHVDKAIEAYQKG